MRTTQHRRRRQVCGRSMSARLPRPTLAVTGAACRASICRGCAGDAGFRNNYRLGAASRGTNETAYQALRSRQGASAASPATTPRARRGCRYRCPSPGSAASHFRATPRRCKRAQPQGLPNRSGREDLNLRHPAPQKQARYRTALRPLRQHEAITVSQNEAFSKLDLARLNKRVRSA